MARMLGTWFADGDLWFSLGTAVEVGGQDQAGIMYGAIEPFFKKGKLRGRRPDAASTWRWRATT